MKKLILILLFLLLSIGYSQYQPVFKYKTNGVGAYFDNWSDTLNAYVWNSIGNDTTITSQLFPPQNGYDGLRQFLLRIDSLGVELDGNSIVIRNFSKPLSGGTSYRQKTVVVDTTSAFNIFFIYQSWLGETFGWVTEDTLEWSLYNDTTRVSTDSVITLAKEATLYTSLFRPTESDGAREYGIWQTQVPTPWRVVGYFPHVASGDTNTVILKLEYADHVPNRR